MTDENQMIRMASMLEDIANSLLILTERVTHLETKVKISEAIDNPREINNGSEDEANDY